MSCIASAVSARQRLGLDGQELAAAGTRDDIDAVLRDQPVFGGVRTDGQQRLVSELDHARSVSA